MKKYSWELVLKRRNPGIVYLLFKVQEVRANKCHYQEVPPENKIHTGHDQFKPPKLIHKPSATNTERRKKIWAQRKPNLAWLSHYLCTGNPLLLNPCPKFLPRLLTVQTVPQLCRGSWWKEMAERRKIVALHRLTPRLPKLEDFP